MTGWVIILRVRVNSIRWVLRSVLGGMLLLAGCAAAPTVARPTAVAPQLRPVLPHLRAVRIPVYLPSWVPPAPRGNYYLLHVNATAAAYSVSFDWTNRSEPVNGNGMTDMAGTLGQVQGGPPHSLDATVAQPGWKLSGRPQPITLPDGRPAFFYPGQGVFWQQGGWRFEVVSFGPIATSPAVVMPLVRSILAALGSTGNPVGPGTRGELLQGLAPDNAAMTLLWDQGGHQYEVWGYAAPALRLARSLVRVAAS